MYTVKKQHGSGVERLEPIIRVTYYRGDRGTPLPHQTLAPHGGLPLPHQENPKSPQNQALGPPHIKIILMCFVHISLLI